MIDSKESVNVTCRFCQKTNRIPVARALRDMGAVNCGGCTSGLFRVNGEPLMDLDNRTLSHKWDYEALDKLKSIPMLDTVLAKVMGATVDKLRLFNHQAGAVRVGPKQMPRLWKLYMKAAGRIDIDPPPLFVVQDPYSNAYTTGANTPLVVVTSGLLDALDDDGVMGVLAHELTHVRLGHVLYRTLALLLANGTLRVLNFMGLANLALRPLRIAMMRWYQMSELSADRGELIATGSLETFVKVHMTMAGGQHRFSGEANVGDFIEQAHEAEEMRDGDLLVWAMEALSSSERSHPLTVWRVHHGLKWAQTQDFFDLLAGKPVIGLPHA